MATFPHSLCGIRFGDHAEQESTAYLRSEVERGIPRQRRNQADTRVSVPCTLLFNSRANADAWRTWAGADGGAWFDFTLPRTGAVVLARIVGGNLGTLKPRSPDWEWSERSVVLEYTRPNFVQLAPGLHTVDSSRILSVQRNSTATYVDEAGVLQTAAANVLRYQGGQVLVEGEATNLLFSSSDFNSVNWGKSATVSSNVATAPDGSITGDGLADSSSLASQDVSRGVDLDGGRYVFSVWIRSSSPVTSRICIRDGDGVVTCSDCVVSAQWTRFHVASLNDSSAAGFGAVWIYPLADPALSGEVFAWGSQLERGAVPSSYIYNNFNFGTVTRLADIVTVAA